MRIRNVLCTSLALCSLLAIAESRSDSALSIYQNSSAEIRIEQISSQISKQFAGTGSNVATSENIVRTQVMDAIEHAYQPQTFEKHILHAIDETLNWRERRKILQWLDTPLGRKASLAEAVAFMNASRNGIQSTIDSAKGLASASKSALVDVVELAAMESALQLDITVYQTSVSAFATNAPNSKSFNNDYKVFHTATDSRREEIAMLNKNYSRSLLAQAYADFSKPEVKALISFWGSPTGTRYSVALRRGIKDAFTEANQTFNDDVKNIVGTSVVASAG